MSSESAVLSSKFDEWDDGWELLADVAILASASLIGSSLAFLPVRLSVFDGSPVDCASTALRFSLLHPTIMHCKGPW